MKTTTATNDLSNEAADFTSNTSANRTWTFLHRFSFISWQETLLTSMTSSFPKVIQSFDKPSTTTFSNTDPKKTSKYEKILVGLI